MRLATFVAPDGTVPLAGEVRDGQAIAFGDGETVLERLISGDRTPAGGRAWPVGQVRLLAPVPQPPAIFGIGLNYAAHAAETGAEAPERPLVFLKLPLSAAPPNEPVTCPAAVRRLDYEGELAVVMGDGSQVAGYAVADDVTGRDLQGREPQWTRAKGADGFCPWGPWITTPDEVESPGELRLRTWVNDGSPRQDASTSDLIFGVPELIRFIAETCTLQPGALILTGTPSGVGMSSGRFLSAGDVVRVQIDGLGVIEHRIA